MPDVPEQHRRKVEAQTRRMPEAMRGVMGGEATGAHMRGGRHGVVVVRARVHYTDREGAVRSFVKHVPAEATDKQLQTIVDRQAPGGKFTYVTRA